MSNYLWKTVKSWFNFCPWCKRNQKRCAHTSAKVVKWLEKGTPMVEVTCSECGWHDFGPVYADPADWVETLP
jgi:RNase P subunit RPR2